MSQQLVATLQVDAIHSRHIQVNYAIPGEKYKKVVMRITQLCVIYVK